MMEEDGSFNRRAVDVIGGWSDSPDRVEFMGTGVGPYLAEPSGLKNGPATRGAGGGPLVSKSNEG